MSEMDQSHWKHLCKKECPECNWNAPGTLEKVKQAVRLFEQRIIVKPGFKTLLEKSVSPESDAPRTVTLTAKSKYAANKKEKKKRKAEAPAEDADSAPAEEASSSSRLGVSREDVKSYLRTLDLGQKKGLAMAIVSLLHPEALTNSAGEFDETVLFGTKQVGDMPSHEIAEDIIQKYCKRHLMNISQLKRWTKVAEEVIDVDPVSEVEEDATTERSPPRKKVRLEPAEPEPFDPIGADPRDLSNEELSKIFEPYIKKHREFITYVGDEHLRKEMKVRVNGKFWPQSSKIKYPPYMKNFKKTTMVRFDGEVEWECLQERVDPDEEMADVQGIYMMAIFMQEARYTRDNVAWMASKIFDPDIDGEHMATMKAKQRKMANDGIEKINQEDDATYACLKATSNPHRNRSVLERFGKMLCILPTIFGQAAGITQHKVHAPTHLASADRMMEDSQLVASHIGDLATLQQRLLTCRNLKRLH